jgi:hypothetical protein
MECTNEVGGCLRRSTGIIALAVLMNACGGRIDGTTEPGGDSGGDASPQSLPQDAGVDASLPDASASADTSSAHDSPDAPLDPALTPCLVGGNVFHVEAGPGDPIYPTSGTMLGTDGSWDGRMGGAPEAIVEVFKGGSSPSWFFVFMVPLDQALHTGTFDPVVGPSPSHTNAGMRIGVDGKWCEQLTGRAAIVELTTTGNVEDPNLVSITATFEQACGGTPTPIRGCVHFAQ